MKRQGWMLVVVAAAVLCLAGCGNVTLRGDALTAAETSAMDAYGAAVRAGAVPESVDPAATPPPTEPWLKGYLVENVRLM